MGNCTEDGIQLDFVMGTTMDNGNTMFVSLLGRILNESAVETVVCHTLCSLFKYFVRTYGNSFVPLTLGSGSIVLPVLNLGQP